MFASSWAFNISKQRQVPTKCPPRPPLNSRPLPRLLIMASVGYPDCLSPMKAPRRKGRSRHGRLFRPCNSLPRSRCGASRFSSKDLYHAAWKSLPPARRIWRYRGTTGGLTVPSPRSTSLSWRPRLGRLHETSPNQCPLIWAIGQIRPTARPMLVPSLVSLSGGPPSPSSRPWTSTEQSKWRPKPRPPRAHPHHQTRLPASADHHVKHPLVITIHGRLSSARTWSKPSLPSPPLSSETSTEGPLPLAAFPSKAP